MTEITDGAGVRWRIVDTTTGRAERITPLPSKPGTRRLPELVRYFPPANTTAPSADNLPASVRNHVIAGMLDALQRQNKLGVDGARKWLASTYADVPPSVRDEVLSLWDRQRFG